MIYWRLERRRRPGGHHCLPQSLPDRFANTSVCPRVCTSNETSLVLSRHCPCKVQTHRSRSQCWYHRSLRTTIAPLRTFGCLPVCLLCRSGNMINKFRYKKPSAGAGEGANDKNGAGDKSDAVTKVNGDKDDGDYVFSAVLSDEQKRKLKVSPEILIDQWRHMFCCNRSPLSIKLDCCKSPFCVAAKRFIFGW